RGGFSLEVPSIEHRVSRQRLVPRSLPANTAGGLGRANGVVDGSRPLAVWSRPLPGFLAAGVGILHGNDPDARPAWLPLCHRGLLVHQTQTRDALGRVALPPVSSSIRWGGDYCRAA